MMGIWGFSILFSLVLCSLKYFHNKSERKVLLLEKNFNYQIHLYFLVMLNQIGVPGLFLFLIWLILVKVVCLHGLKMSYSPIKLLIIILLFLDFSLLDIANKQ